MMLKLNMILWAECDGSDDGNCTATPSDDKENVDQDWDM
jgi:hypothetical protein